MTKEVESFEELDSVRDEYLLVQKQYRSLVKASGKKLFKKMFNDFFSKHPEVAAITWVQYTPYFNDGDPCRFRVHEVHAYDPRYAYNDNGYLILTENPKTESIGEIRRYQSWEFFETKCLSSWKDDPVLTKDFQNVVSRIEKFEANSMQELFGEDSWVIVTKDGIDIEEFEHD